jgi:hypothetical protein
VNKIPYLLTLSRKICFTAVNHVMDITVQEIFKACKEIYQYSIAASASRQSDGEFLPRFGGRIFLR